MRRRVSMRRWFHQLACRSIPFVLLSELAMLPGATIGTGSQASPPHAISKFDVPQACPWLDAHSRDSSPTQLAREVASRMSLAQKAEFVVLRADGFYENENEALPSLCIPLLTLQDGPNGIAYGASGVTQLPASIGVAASFDPSMAYRYGQVLGEEARGKGIDVVQGPNLNLARVPESGRIFEGYGEDPYLVSQMGDADIEGIQSAGVLADAKHFTAYNQETARSDLDERVSERALEELYLAPFRSAVEQAHVASLMCSYGALNGVNDCSDPALYHLLYGTWGFTGFVRSDLEAVKNPAAAFDAGLSLLKPATPQEIVTAVEHGRLSMKALNSAVDRVLTTMFRYGLIEHPIPLRPTAKVATPAHAQVALSAAETSMVLLKNDGVLPLKRNGESIAVIGSDAASGATSAGSGSARVVAPFVITPLGAISRWVSPATGVSYAEGAPGNVVLAPIPAVDFSSGGPLPITPPVLNRDRHEPGTSDLHIIRSAGVTRAIETAAEPLPGPYPWSVWQATVVPPATGLYDISLSENGDAWLTVDGRQVMAFRGLHGHCTWTTAIPLVAHHSYRLVLKWFQTGDRLPQIGWQDVTPLINEAVAKARAARLAVVFANDFSSEGFDRPDLSLPGDEDALISAVAAANRRTVVVLNTGGAVLMPWLQKVAGVLEAWYPGEEDGAATAAVLFGAFDPSGRLPLTFPASNAAVPTGTSAQWPGIDGTVTYSEGLNIGYRWYEAKHVKPLFPFGFGLSYTSFHLGMLRISRSRQHDELAISVTNTGRRTGTDVLQCYLEYPKTAGEPPRQLRAFSRVTLQPGQTRTVDMFLDRSDFTEYLDGRFVVPSGTFVAWVGSSSSDLPRSIDATPLLSF